MLRFRAKHFAQDFFRVKDFGCEATSSAGLMDFDPLTPTEQNHAPRNEMSYSLLLFRPEDDPAKPRSEG